MPWERTEFRPYTLRASEWVEAAEGYADLGGKVSWFIQLCQSKVEELERLVSARSCQFDDLPQLTRIHEKWISN